METIRLPIQCQIRRSSGNTIEGYGAVYYEKGRPDTEFRSGGVVERILPGAFEGLDFSGVLVTYDHSQVLAKPGNGTAEIRADEKGLWFRAQLNPNDPEAVSVLAKVERGDVSGASFSFTDPTVVREHRNNIIFRNISGFGQIHDIGPVPDGAYKGPAVSVRSYSKELAILEQERKNSDILYRAQQALIRNALK